ncbi:uncharacterized protein LOC116351708, partial [Contarinia nasturtii]|uniref:uncharacterized protein LOC116351708 n=1 Tax=Contarinia nasturtii TaxID=265458 RepID=UPI0012D41983
YCLIFSGVSTITYFTGGHIAYCHFATFGLFLSIITALIFGSYHVWRICMTDSTRKSSRHSVRQRSGETIIMTTTRSSPTEDEIPSGYWIPAAFTSGFFVLYSLIFTIVYIDGAWTSCRQYRNELIKYMHATGNLVAAVQGRISCSAVFDFMDFLFSDVSFDRRRIDRIDTSWCLNLGILSSIGTFILWCSVFFINIVQARSTNRLRE